jgi:hypothetical protein
MNLFSNVQQIAAKLPEGDWLRFGILLLVLLTVLQAIRLVSRVNRYAMFVFFLMGATILMANWVHNRNEPAFMTPVVNALAPWFPKSLRSYDV